MRADEPPCAKQRSSARPGLRERQRHIPRSPGAASTESQARHEGSGQPGGDRSLPSRRRRGARARGRTRVEPRGLRARNPRRPVNRSAPSRPSARAWQRPFEARPRTVQRPRRARARWRRPSLVHRVSRGRRSTAVGAPAIGSGRCSCPRPMQGARGSAGCRSRAARYRGSPGRIQSGALPSGRRVRRWPRPGRARARFSAPRRVRRRHGAIPRRRRTPSLLRRPRGTATPVREAQSARQPRQAVASQLRARGKRARTSAFVLSSTTRQSARSILRPRSRSGTSGSSRS